MIRERNCSIGNHFKSTLIKRDSHGKRILSDIYSLASDAAPVIFGYFFGKIGAATAITVARLLMNMKIRKRPMQNYCTITH